MIPLLPVLDSEVLMQLGKFISFHSQQGLCIRGDSLIVSLSNRMHFCFYSGWFTWPIFLFKQLNLKFCLQLNIGNNQFSSVSHHCFLASARLVKILLVTFLFLFFCFCLVFTLKKKILELYQDLHGVTKGSDCRKPMESNRKTYI